VFLNDFETLSAAGIIASNDKKLNERVNELKLLLEN
jgi:hypothetical protein